MRHPYSLSAPAIAAVLAFQLAASQPVAAAKIDLGFKEVCILVALTPFGLAVGAAKKIQKSVNRCLNSEAPVAMDYDDAVSHCEKMGGRLPTALELAGAFHSAGVNSTGNMRTTERLRFRNADGTYDSFDYTSEGYEMPFVSTVRDTENQVVSNVWSSSTSDSSRAGTIKANPKHERRMTFDIFYGGIHSLQAPQNTAHALCVPN